MAASAKGEHPQSGDTDGISVRKFQVTKLKKESFRPATESARRGFVFVCQCAWFGGENFKAVVFCNHPTKDRQFRGVS